LIVIFVFVCWLIFNVLLYFYYYPNKFVFELKKSLGQSDLNANKANALFGSQFLLKYLNSSKVTHEHVLEIVWTLVPSIVLILIAIPSFALLYAMDEVISPSITLKVIGHQWYWSYEYSDFDVLAAINGKAEAFNNYNINFTSYMVPEDELELGQFRLLEVDNPVVLPINTHVRVIITAGDVLHAWAVPSLGVKMDAVPGRLNQTSIYIKRPGKYFGQCSELCGVNHGFMPIVVHAVSLKDYLSWLHSKFEV